MATELKLLTEFDAAPTLAWTPQQLKKRAKAGEVPCVILPGGEIRFLEADLKAWVEEHRREVRGDA